MKRKAPGKIRILQLAAVIFFTVSGGPYGLEPLLQYAGNHLSILLLLVVPFLWDIPAILTVLELNSMMPVEGGYYKWVKTALGNRFGFYEGIWTWFYTFVDLAIYPVLFVQYTCYLFPGLEVYKLPLCLLLIWPSAILNITGIVPVGSMSFILSNLVLFPFLLLFIIFISHHAGPIPMMPAKDLSFSSFGLALYTIMWNFLGWDNVTTYAEEVENPVRSYIISIFIAFITVLAIYLGVMWVAGQSGIDHAVLTKQGFPALGALVGGRWLGILIACGGMASAIGMYNANILSISRVPMAMANDGLLPTILGKVHKKYQTPYVSILICSFIVSLLVAGTLGELLVVDVTIYGAGLFLEFFSLIKMRIKAPDKERPFRIPLGVSGLCVLIALPIMVYIIALTGICQSGEGVLNPAYVMVGVVAITEVMWRVLVWRRPGVRG